MKNWKYNFNNEKLYSKNEGGFYEHDTNFIDIDSYGTAYHTDPTNGLMHEVQLFGENYNKLTKEFLSDLYLEMNAMTIDEEIQNQVNHIITYLQETGMAPIDNLYMSECDLIELLETMGYDTDINEFPYYLKLNYQFPTIEKIAENLVGTELIPGEISDNISEMFENHRFKGETKVIVENSDDRHFDYVCYIDHVESPQVGLVVENNIITRAIIL